MRINTVVIIIPTYNEALIIEETIHQVFKATAMSEIDFSILIFDSCSKDNTQELVLGLQKIYPKLYLLSEPKKTGLGSAYLQAMHYVLNHWLVDVIVEFDADLSHQPQYLLSIMEKMQDYEVVVGSRYISGGSIPSNWGWHRKVLSKLGNYVARSILTLKYKDFTSGFRATRNEALRQALPKQFISNHYAYKLELLWNLHKNKAKITEYPIEFIDREKGESKLPANSIFDSLKVIFILRLKELKSYMHMCMVGFVGLLIQGLIYNILRIHYSPFFSVQIAVIAAAINNFILNNYFTFRKRALNQRIKSFAFFIGYSLIMVAFQSNWVKLGSNYFGTGYLKENLIMFTGIGLGSILNYLFYSRMIWKKKGRRDPLPSG